MPDERSPSSRRGLASLRRTEALQSDRWGGIPPGKNKTKQKKSDTESDTHRRRDWRQLHEPVRADGAHVPGRTSGRVRRGDTRSNQQPGVHSPVRGLMRKRLVCDTGGGEQ